MAKILKIDPITDGVRYIIKFYLESEKVAKHFDASCLMSVREIYRPADLYVKENALYLDTPNKDMTDHIGTLLKNTIESTAIIP
jgi:hypothetical protein